MRTLTAVLVIAFVATALVACGEEPAPKTSNEAASTPDQPATPDQPDTPDVTPEPTPGGAIASTAGAAFGLIQSALGAKEFASFYEMLSADSRQAVEARIEQARALVGSAGSGIPGAADMAKSQLGDKFGFSYDDLMKLPTKDLAGKVIGKLFGDKIPGGLTGEVQGEPKVDGDTATVSVKKANGSVKDVEMVREDDAWKLKYDI